MKRQLKDYEKKLLEDGNCYTIGNLLIEFYPKDMEREGYDLRKHVNYYRSYIGWNAEDKMYTFFGKDGKVFFNTNADCVGFKPW